MPLPDIKMNGNLTADPEIRYLNDGTPVVSMRVACNERYKRDGQWIDGTTTFMKVNAWRRLAENVINNLTKGDPVLIHGKLKQNDYVDNNGNNKISFEVEADAIAKAFRYNQTETQTDSWSQDKF